MMLRQSYLSDTDREVLVRGKFGTRMGFGAKPAVIDMFLRRGPSCSIRRSTAG